VCPRDESRGASWERTRYGYTQVHSGGRSRSDASRALPTSRSQALVADKQGASRREARSTADAGHGPRKGERVLGTAQTINVGDGPACEFRLAGSRYDGRCSRALARIALTGGVKRGPRLAGQFSVVPSARSTRSDSASVGTEVGRACLQVTTRASDGRRGLVKAPRGPRRSKGSSHPRR
jgi:hypothetical protein